MYRHDGRRSGSTAAPVPADCRPGWRVSLGGKLTPPVAAGGRVFVASVNTHTVHALDARDGRRLWSYTAGGRVDSPPTLHQGSVLFGCADGWVYCLRAADGVLAWRFHAAPADRLVGAFGQLESAWRVHGSVLVKDGPPAGAGGAVLYCTAGRSTFLDGGIYVYALDPATGRKLRQRRLDGPHPDPAQGVDERFLPAFHVEGARSDLLVTDGEFLYMSQIKLDADLVQQPVPYVPHQGHQTVGMDLYEAPFVDTEFFKKPFRRLSSYQDFPKLGVLRGPMGDRTMGLHLLATGGFLDDTWFNRTYWMYGATWPGYYIAHLAAKAGQLLVIDRTTTYGVQAFPSRNIHSPTFTPGRKGYLLFADANTNEPVLDHRARGRDKGMGYTRSAPPRWFRWVPVRVRAMVVAGDVLFAAGPPDLLDREDPMAAFEGRKGAVLLALSARDGTTLAERSLDAPPVFDGLIAACGRLYLSTRDGHVLCLEKNTHIRDSGV